MARERETEKVRPVHEVRLGRIKAAIWANSTENGVRHNVTFSRLYKDGDAWKDSDSFGRDDLLLLSKLADQAHTWVCAQGAGSNSRPANDEPY
jgi:hypothetical protein